MIERIIFITIFGLAIVGLSLFMVKVFSIGLKLSHVAERNSTLPGIFVPLLYILSFITIRNSVSWLSSVSYYILNIIAGVFFYLIIGALVLGIILTIRHFLGMPINSAVAAVVLGVSLLFSIAGFIQARLVKVVDYDVTLSGAPLSWNGKTAVLVADTHFGVINNRRFSNKVVDRILALKPDLVLHAGDFYDGPKLDTAPITESWKRLASATPVFYAPGNHEMYGDYEAFMTSVTAAGVTLLDDKAARHDGVQIAGLLYRDRGRGAEAARVLSSMQLDRTTPTILINHPPAFHREAKDAGVSLMVSGHTHRGQFWPLGALVKMIYGKYVYGMQDFEGMQSLTTSGVGTFGPPLRLFNTPELVRLHFTVK